MDEFEYRVKSKHFNRDNPALSAAIKEYTTPLWPFGRKEKAFSKLQEKQNNILAAQGIELSTSLGGRVKLILEAENKEEADKKMEKLRQEIEAFYKRELGLDIPFEYSSQ